MRPATPGVRIMAPMQIPIAATPHTTYIAPVSMRPSRHRGRRLRAIAALSAAAALAMGSLPFVLQAL